MGPCKSSAASYHRRRQMNVSMDATRTTTHRDFSYRHTSENLPASGCYIFQIFMKPVGAAFSRECIAPEGAPTEI